MNIKVTISLLGVFVLLLTSCSASQNNPSDVSRYEKQSGISYCNTSSAHSMNAEIVSMPQTYSASRNNPNNVSKYEKQFGISCCNTSSAHSTNAEVVSMPKTYSSPLSDSAILAGKLDNKTDISRFIFHEYADDMLKDWYSFSLPRGISSQSGHLYLLNQKYPVELIRRQDSKNYYAVYKIKNGGFLFVYFENLGNDWLRLHTSVYCEKQLQKTDFDRVKIGTPISDVIKIDPTAQYATKNLDNPSCTTSKHLLKDGFILIVYQKKNDTFVVSQLQYNKDFIGDFILDKYNFRILPEDYAALKQ